MRRSADRPGFTPAADRLISELQAALVSPDELTAIVKDLDDPGYELELAAIYSAYTSFETQAAAPTTDRSRPRRSPPFAPTATPGASGPSSSTGSTTCTATRPS